MKKRKKRDVFSPEIRKTRCEFYMVKDIYYGKTLRKSFARHQELLEMPNLLEIQKNSYRWFS